MDFYAMLDQVIALLRQRQRVTYRALKVQFHLDDETLEALKEELIEAQQLATDEAGRILAWIGSADTISSAPPSSAQHAPQPATQDAHPSQVEAAAARLPPLDAERRQLTVMFCDLVESTRLASQIDPEELREVVRAYQQVCAAVITQFDGHIAQLLGDGLLVYFGYPQAHEDDAQRAVQSGLGMVKAIGTLTTRLEHEQGIRLAVRVGIHTGLVVVGPMGAGRQEQLALGETPNVAARLQGLAAPNTVMVSDATWRLVQGYFAGHALAPQVIKGIETPLQVYQVVGTSGAQSRLDVVPPRGFTPLVGREAELALLRARWGQAREGLGQVVVLSGEAGIGKSRLVQGLQESLTPEPHVRVEWRCSPYAQQSPLHPVIAHLHRLLHWRPEDAAEDQLRTLEETLTAYGFGLPEVVPLFAGLLSLPLPERYPSLSLTPQRQRQQTLEALLTWLLAEAIRQPVLFMVEDLHWIDPSTLEFLTLLLDRGSTAPLLTLLTCRPEFAVPWGFRAHLTPLTLSRLPQPQVAQMSVHVARGKALPAEVLAQIMARTDGVPLFVEELTKMVLESGLLQEWEERYELTGPLPPLAIPATLQDALMARLDRLAEGKAVAQLGATLGRTFSYALLQAMSSMDERVVWRGLLQLVEAEVLYQQGVPPQATYTFKHALIQETAYQTLLKSTRQLYHRRTAQVLLERFPATVETQPELLAHHYTEAGLTEQAVDYWQRAGDCSKGRSAYAEAVAHYTKGLAMLRTLPDTPTRPPRELDMQVALGQVLQVVKGPSAPEVGHAYARARALCQQAEDSPRLFAVLVGLAGFYMYRGESQTARELREQLLTLAQRQHDPEYLARAHAVLGHALLYLGEFAAARAHLEQALACAAAPQDGSRPSSFNGISRVHALGHTAWVLWWLGYPDQAQTRSHEMLTCAQALQHTHTLVAARNYTAALHKLRGEADVTLKWAEAILALATEQGFGHFVGLATFWRGWALAVQGQHAEGIAQMHQGLAAQHALERGVTRAELLARLGEAYGRSHQTEEGLRLLAKALAVKEKDPWYEAELYRIQGELLLRQAVPDTPQAEACFQQALAVARRQQAKSYELRAAISLSRLWQCQDQSAAARELLGPVYGWFTEGFGTPDLQEAKALLDALANGVAQFIAVCRRSK